MRIEAIEPRRLMAAGLDTTFAGGGTLVLGRGVQRSGTPLALSNAIYVGATDGNRGYVYKFDGNGKPQTAWGDHGRTAVDVRPQKMAIDRRSGAIFVAGHSLGEQGPLEGVYVARVDARGALDASYGDHGRGGYVPTLGTYDYIGTTVAGLYAMSHNRVLLAMTLQSTETGLAADADRRTGSDDLALVRFAGTGNRDVTFGRRGVRTLFSGRSVSQNIEGTRQVNAYDAPTLADVQFRSDDSVQVIFTRNLVRQTSFYNATNTTQIEADAYVDARVLTPNGTFNELSTRTWHLGTTKPADAVGSDARQLLPLAARLTGTDTVRAYAIRDLAKPLVYDLTPSNDIRAAADPQPVPIALPQGGAVNVAASAVGVLPFGAGGFFVTNAQRSVVKFRADGMSDRGFGRAGVATFDATNVRGYHSYAADADGRLLVLTNDAIRRVARGSRSSSAGRGGGVFTAVQ